MFFFNMNFLSLFFWYLILNLFLQEAYDKQYLLARVNDVINRGELVSHGVHWPLQPLMPFYNVFLFSKTKPVIIFWYKNNLFNIQFSCHLLYINFFLYIMQLLSYDKFSGLKLWNINRIRNCVINTCAFFN